jgi:nucleotide-binding universal stress UspA family protein
MGIERILAATDFSPPSERAVQRASRLARLTGAQLRIVHVAPERGALERWLGPADAGEADMLRGAGVALSDVCAAVEAAHGVRPSSGLVVGKAARSIDEAADSFDADVVVVGARGENESQFREPSLGGTAVKLLKRARLPLLLVRRPADEDYRRVLIAVGAGESARRVVAGAKWIAERAQCCLLRAYEVPFAARLRGDVAQAAVEAYASEQQKAEEAALASLAADAGFEHPPRSVVVRGAAAGVVLSELHVLDPDLVVVGKHERDHRDALVELGGVALAVASAAHCDVLQVP